MRVRLVPGLVLAAAALGAALPARGDDLFVTRGPAPALKGEPGGRARSYYLYCLSQQAMLRRDYAEALRLLEDASRADPKEQTLALELGRVYLNLEEPEKALAEIERAAALDPNALEPKRLLVETYRQRLSREEPVTADLFDRALAAQKDLLASDPADSDARLGLAKLYLARGLPAQATEVLRDQMAREPASVEGAYLLGQALAQSGALEEARKVLEEAIRLHPQYPELKRALADLIESAGDLQGAASILRELVGSRPDRVDYRIALARVLARLERPEEAAVEASRLVEALAGAAPGTSQESDLRAAHLLLIDMLLRAERTAEALEAALRAETQFPGEVVYRLRRAEILLLEGRQAEADAIFEALSRLSGPSRPAPAVISEVFLRAGAQMEKRKDLDRAEALLRQAVSTDPKNHQALNYLGYMLAERGVRVEEGLAFVERAVALDGENGAYQDSLGWALFRLGRHSDAKGPLERAAQLIPEEAVVHDHLGDLYQALGKPEEAIKAWSEAIRLGIGSADEVRRKLRKVSGEIQR